MHATRKVIFQSLLFDLSPVGKVNQKFKTCRKKHVENEAQKL